MKEKVRWLGYSFLTAYALTTVFRQPFAVAEYETTLDYIIASIYELLGEYDFRFLCIWGLAYCFYTCLHSKYDTKGKSSKLLAAFFAACLLLGRSYYELHSWDYCFGSAVNLIKTGLAFGGYTIFFHRVMEMAAVWMNRTEFVGEKPHFFSRRPFLKSFLILLAVYGGVVLISYPGTLCWDTIGQIEQVTKGTGYSAHHPLPHTLLVGGLVEFGYRVFGAYETGLFLYMLLQVILWAAALAFTVVVLAKRNVKFRWLAGLMLLYCITPIYSNLVSVAIKDIPYCAFVIGYAVCFALLIEDPNCIRNRRFLTGFVLTQIGCICFRNNGLIMVLLSGLGALFFLWKQYAWKERIRFALFAFLVSILIAKTGMAVMAYATDAAQGSSGEMLSIPFQQTARYLQLYKGELDLEERAAIEAVLGPVDQVAAMYDPKISDPVKALFDKNATGKEMVEYMMAWAKGFFRHPLVYVEAFLDHIYGWFTPGVSNAIRYEVQYEDISQQGLFPGAQKILIFLYRFADRISVLGLLQNVGAFVWGLFFLTAYQKREKKNRMLLAGLPLWISLLVCMASPCFIYHPRYALPIISVLPFLYVMTLSGKGREERSYER